MRRIRVKSVDLAGSNAGNRETGLSTSNGCCLCSRSHRYMQTGQVGSTCMSALGVFGLGFPSACEEWAWKHPRRKLQVLCACRFIQWFDSEVEVLRHYVPWTLRLS